VDDPSSLVAEIRVSWFIYMNESLKRMFVLVVPVTRMSSGWRIKHCTQREIVLAVHALSAGRVSGGVLGRVRRQVVHSCVWLHAGVVAWSHLVATMAMMAGDDCDDVAWVR
jgi:hypothetical protein